VPVSIFRGFLGIDEVHDPSTIVRFGRDGWSGDRGATMPIVGVMLVSVLAFAGFAVDLGTAYGYRRQAQAAADAGSLGGGQALTNTALTTTGRLDRAAVFVKYLTYNDVVQQGITPAQWNAAWASCTDPQRLAVTAPATSVSAVPVWPADASGTQCISFSTNGQRMRVRTPNQLVRTSFASLVGVKSWNASAGATVEITLNPGGGVLPYGIPQSAAGANEVCLKAGAGNVPDPLCSGGDTGNFGLLDISLYGNVSIGNQFECAGSNNAHDRSAFNTALGVDHPLSLFPSVGGNPYATGAQPDNTAFRKNDATTCNATNPPDWVAQPNALDVDTGNSMGGVQMGMIDGWSGTLFGVGATKGRLAQGSNQKRLVQLGRDDLDDWGLWNYINPALTSATIPASCVASSFDSGSSAWLNTNTINPPAGYFAQIPAYARTTTVNGVTQPLYKQTLPNKSKWHMMRCLRDYIAVGYTVPLFGKDSDGDSTNGHYDIMDSPRFAYVPQLWDDFDSGSSVNNNGGVRIWVRRAVFLETGYWGCNNGSGGCDAAWSPQEGVDAVGFGAVGTSAADLDAMSALVIRAPMLPTEIQDLGPGGANQIGVQLIR
jgi:hypothetical protein